MDCAHCEPILLDLCYGELPPQVERDARAHVAECATCRRALSRLEAGQALARQLPEEVPSPELTARIMNVARSNVRRSPWSFLVVQDGLESIARVAMTRQVAMATLSLLIVFVGLWSIPELTRRRDARSAPLVDPVAHEGEAGPSRDVMAAAPAASPSAPSAQSEPKPARSAPTARANNGARSLPRKAAESSGRLERGAELASAQRARPEAKLRDRISHSRFAPAPGAAAPPEPSAIPAEQPLVGQEDEALEVPMSEKRGPEEVAAMTDSPDRAVAADPSAPELQPSAAPAPKLDDIFKAGLERYRADDFPAAAQLFARMLESSAPSGQRAAALLYLARSERALGRCDRAIRAYETLVHSYGSAQQSSAALLEGVECYDRLGDTMGAQRLLEHATSVPSLATQATRSLHERNSRNEAPASKPAKP